MTLFGSSVVSPSSHWLVWNDLYKSSQFLGIGTSVSIFTNRSIGPAGCDLQFKTHKHVKTS